MWPRSLWPSAELVGREVPVTSLPLGMPLSWLQCQCGLMSGSPPSERPGSLDSPTVANRSNLPIPRQMKSNKAAKSTTIPSAWAKAKQALQAIPTITITAALTLPL